MKPASLGEQLREWRVRRRMSQMDLALDTEISTRHLSFIETGRSKPSAQMLQRIADCLSSLDAQIAAESEKLDALRTHKRGLMQRLFPLPEGA